MWAKLLNVLSLEAFLGMNISQVITFVIARDSSRYKYSLDMSLGGLGRIVDQVNTYTVART